jgi:hypothetical protein
MSESDPAFISIGCEGGGPETKSVCQLKVPLDFALRKHVTSSHCSAVDSYGLVIRVDGSLAKYGAEGLARLRYAKVRRNITVDIQIPEASWQGKSEPELRAYIAAQVKRALSACVERLLREEQDVAVESLMAEIEIASREYLASGGGA